MYKLEKRMEDLEKKKDLQEIYKILDTKADRIDVDNKFRDFDIRRVQPLER